MGLLAKAMGAETRNFLRNPDRWVLQAFGGIEASSGVQVDEDRALEWTALGAALRVLSNSQAQIPLNVYRRLEGGGKELDRDNPLFPVLHDTPNSEMTSFEFRALIPVHAVLWGFFAAEIVKNTSGTVLELWPQNPDRVTRERTGRGEIRYRVQLPGGGVNFIPADRMLYIPGFVSDPGLIGRGMVDDHKEAIGLGLATELYGARFFGNDASPGGILRHPDTLSPESRKHMKESWEAAHRSMTNKHRVAILEEGVEWQQIMVDPEKAQFLGLRQFQITEAARIVGIPPHMIADLSRATFSNIEQQGIDFVTYSLTPWLKKIEQRMSAALLPRSQARSHFVEHVVDGLLRGDSAARAQFYAQAFNIGAMSINDIRSKENLNPVEGGDRHFVPLNMVPLDQAGAMSMDERALLLNGSERRIEAVPNISGEYRSPTLRLRLIRSFRPMFLDAAERLSLKEIQALRKAIKRFSNDAGDWKEFLASFYFEDFPPVVRQIMEPVFRAYAEAVAAAAAEEVNADVDEERRERYTTDYTESFTNEYSARGRRQMQKLADETPQEELADAVNQRLDDWAEGAGDSRPRHQRVAEQQIVQLSGGITRDVWLAAGIAALVWRTIGDTCPMCRRLSGRKVGITAGFVQEGEEFFGDDGDTHIQPRRTIRYPPLHAGCDCYIAPGL